VNERQLQVDLADAMSEGSESVQVRVDLWERLV